MLISCSNKLIESLESDIDENTQNLWNIEAKKRRDEIRNYTVESIPGEVALSQVRRILEKRYIFNDNIDTNLITK